MKLDLGKTIPSPVLEALREQCDAFSRVAAPLVEELQTLTQVGTENLTAAQNDRLIEISTKMGDIAREVLKGKDIIILGINGNPSSPRESRPGDRSVISLKDVHHTDTIATAKAEMFFSEWSKDFIHGPETILPIAKLAEKLLESGEKIAVLSRITWKKPAKNNLRIIVIVGELPADNDNQYCFDGSLLTNNGRILSFYALEEPNDPINIIASFNPFAEHMMSMDADDAYRQDGIWNIDLKRLPKDLGIALDTEPAIKIATLLEIITLAFVIVTNHEPALQGSKLKLMGGVKDLAIPETIDSISKGESTLQLRVQIEKAKIGKSGLRIIPFEYKFPHQTGFSLGFVAETKNKQKASEHCSQ